MLIRMGLMTAGLLAIAGCRPVLVNVPSADHGTLGTGVIRPPAISDSGDIVAFATADFLTAEDHEGVEDVYVRDTRRQQTSLMSISPTGGQDPCGSRDGFLSGDGRYVGFDSCSAVTVVQSPAGTNPTFLVIKDRATGELERIGVPHDLAPTVVLGGGEPAVLDRDGSHVAFFCPISSAPPFGVCLQDRRTGATTLVSIRTDGQVVGVSVLPTSISDDGHLVAFVAKFADVVAGSFDTRVQLFIRDVTANVTRPVLIDASLLSGDLDGRISGDGTAAVIWQTQPPYHIVHKDLVSGAEHRVDQAECNSVTPSTTYNFASISDDGDVVAFQSSSDALVPHDSNNQDDVFVWRAALPCKVQRISTGPRSREGDGDSYWPEVSGDGSSVAFVSDATNLVDNDTNARPDVFVVRIGLPRS